MYEPMGESGTSRVPINRLYRVFPTRRLRLRDTAWLGPVTRQQADPDVNVSVGLLEDKLAYREAQKCASGLQPLAAPNPGPQAAPAAAMATFSGIPSPGPHTLGVSWAGPSALGAHDAFYT